MVFAFVLLVADIEYNTFIDYISYDPQFSVSG